jgi:hypothetical protein
MSRETPRRSERPLHRLRARAAGLLVGGLALAATAPAAAQTSGDKAAAAQALFDEGMRLMRAGDAVNACPKLEESQRIDPGMATQFRIAECYEQTGKVASAWASFVAVADAAAVAKLPEREAAARKRAQALLPRIGRLTIAVPADVAAAPGLEVRRDGLAVAAPLWGVPIPVDPGDHVVRAQAPGKKPWEGHVQAAQGAGVVASVPPLEDLPRAAPDAAGPPVGPPQKAATSGSAPRSRLGAGVALGAVAVAGVVTGAALYAVRGGKRSDAETLSGQIAASHGTCVAGRADPRCSALASDASSSDTFGNASTAAFAIGGAAAAAMALTFVWPSSTDAAPSARFLTLTPSAGAARGGLSVSGSF